MAEQVTVIEYQYADAAGYKQHATVVLPGTLTSDEVVRVWAETLDGEEFLPAQVGLPALQHLMVEDGYALGEDDHVWHSITEIRTEDAGVTEGTVKPYVPVSAGDWAAKFVGIDWDIMAATEDLYSLVGDDE